MINIEDLTIKQARELSKMFSAEPLNTVPEKHVKSDSSLLSNILGKYVIVRSRNEGINCGFVKDLDDTGIILTEARRLYYHKPKDSCMSWYEGVSISGLSKDSKISNPVSEKGIIEDYSYTVCSESAKESLINAIGNEQN